MFYVGQEVVCIYDAGRLCPNRASCPKSRAVAQKLRRYFLYGAFILFIIVSGGKAFTLSAPMYGGLGGIWNLPPIMSIGTSSGPLRSSGITDRSPPSHIPASFKMLTSGSPSVGSPVGFANACLSNSMFAELCASGLRKNIWIFIPALWSAFATCVANHVGSRSTSAPMLTASIFPLSFCKILNCDSVSDRGASCDSRTKLACRSVSIRSEASSASCFWSLITTAVETSTNTAAIAPAPSDSSIIVFQESRPSPSIRLTVLEEVVFSICGVSLIGIFATMIWVAAGYFREK